MTFDNYNNIIKYRGDTMLCQFMFKNFKSYRDKTILDMQAVSNQGFPDSLLKTQNRDDTLPVAVIYGPNGGGKSNVLNALNFLHELVTRPVAYLKNNDLRNRSTLCEPFLFDETSRNEPSEFEVFFRIDCKCEYKYNIAVYNGKIVYEMLYRKGLSVHSRIVMLFERNENEIVLGASINKSNINTEVNEQMPYLSFLAVNYKLEPINTAIKWFENNILRNYADPYTEMNLFIRQSDEFKNKLLTLMNDAGICISNYEFIEKSAKENMFDIIFEHTVNNGKYQLKYEQESNGTQKLFNVLPLVIFALSEGRVLVIDELDAKLHPKLLKFIIMLFKNSDINRKNAQLIFTSHDISTMKSSVFRTDEIWFSCKNESESSDLYSLYEIRDENGNHISQNAAFDKQYLAGRYGADPYFQHMMDWK